MRVIYLMIIISFLYINCLAQDKILFAFSKHISTTKLLSPQVPRKIIQDKYGYMWIATQDGLNRFDGINNKMYTKANPENTLLGADTWDLLEDTSRNLVWCISAYGGLNAISTITGKIERAIPYKSSNYTFPNEWIKCMLLYNNQVWMGTYNGVAIYDIASNTMSTLNMESIRKQSLDSNLHINLISASGNNIFLMVANYGIVIMDGRSNEIVQQMPLQSLNQKPEQVLVRYSCVEHMDGNHILLGTNKGLIIIQKTATGAYENVSLPGCLKIFEDETILTSSMDDEKNVWLSTFKGVFKFQQYVCHIQQVKNIVNNAENDYLESIYTIYFDDHHQIWVGGAKGILYAANSHSIFQSYYSGKDGKLNVGHCNYNFPLNDSAILCCKSDGVAIFDKKNGSVRNLVNSGNYKWAGKYLDRLWITGQKGIFIIENGRMRYASEYYPGLKDIDHLTTSNVCAWNNRLLVFINEDGNGLFLWNFITGELHHIPFFRKFENVPVKPFINDLLIKNADTMLLMCDDGIYSLSANTLSVSEINIAHHPSLSNEFFDATKIKNGFAFAQYGYGVVCTDNQYNFKTSFTTGNGLSNSGVFKVMLVNDSILLATTNNGLNWINLNSGRVKNYFAGDGLHSNDFAERNGYIDSNLIVAGGDNGFSVIMVNDIYFNAAPPRIYFNTIDISTDDISPEKKRYNYSDIEAQQIIVPENYLQLLLTLSGINFSAPHKVQFAYRLLNHQADWITLKNTNQIQLIGLPPGTYTLEVKAANEDDVWSEPKKLQIVFLPKWYQTWQFKVLIALLIAALIYILYRLQIRQLLREQRMKAKISADLHDDIGSTLTSMNIFVDLAMKDNDKLYLPQIKEGVQDAIMATREMIWVMDNKSNTAAQLQEKIAQFATRVTKANGIVFSLGSDSGLEVIILEMEERRNLYLISKEFITNSIKYAGCKKIHLNIVPYKKQLKITINDDGCGFNPVTVKRGNGLNNISGRAASIGYKAFLVSKEGGGTQLQIIPSSAVS